VESVTRQRVQKNLQNGVSQKEVPLILERIDIIEKYVETNKDILTDPYFIHHEAKVKTLLLLDCMQSISAMSVEDAENLHLNNDDSINKWEALLQLGRS
jgi:hypothetical protein